MIVIQITDCFLLKEPGRENRDFFFPALVVWGIGFVLYRVFLAVNPVCGSTLPVMGITAALRAVYATGQQLWGKLSRFV